MGLILPGGTQFNPIVPNNLNVVGGAAGWVTDQDFSAIIPAAAVGKTCLFAAYHDAAGAQAVGVRDTDGATDITMLIATGVNYAYFLAKCLANTRLFDLYRGASDAHYYYMGYFN